MTSPPRILIALPQLGRGGPDRVMFEVACGLADLGWSVHVATVDGPGQRVHDLPEVVTHSFTRTVPVRLDRRYPVHGLARELRRLRPDVLLTTHHMNYAAYGALRLVRDAPLWAMRPTTTTSSHVEDVGSERLRHRIAHRAMTRMIERCDLLVAQSRDMADDARLLGRSGPIAVIGNPAPPRPVNVVGADGRDRVIAYVGRLSREKGPDLLVDAFARAQARADGYTLDLWGDGPMRVQLAEQARALGMSGVVRFRGTASDSLAAMAHAALVVVPSRYDGFSNVIIEALSVGTPVVATSCPGAAREVIVHEALGRLSPPEDPGALGVAMDAALAGEPDHDAIAALVQEAWNRERVIEAYDAALRALADPPGGTSRPGGP
ncbi:MAG: glycosyltransferase [Actinomycetota bacterium]|nr:glycosyltransferase [Actinomycetota bacterium]